jgi:hypothetical protein
MLFRDLISLIRSPTPAAEARIGRAFPRRRQVHTNGRPMETAVVPPGTPTWGAQWKQAATII